METKESKRFQLWEFSTTGERVVGYSNNKNYLIWRSKKLMSIWYYIIDAFSGE